MTKNAEKKPETFLLAAFAIEDRVDFKFVEHSYHGDSSPIEEVKEARSVIPSEKIRMRRRDQSDYFEQIYDFMRNQLIAFESLYRDQNSPNTIFDKLDQIVISMPGVIEDNRILIQLPLWNWETETSARWRKDGVLVPNFDFGQIICDIVEAVEAERPVKTNLETLISKIFVVNDATACAAVEYNFRQREKISNAPHSFVFIKAHTGINVGMVEDGYVFTKKAQPEMGHFYPNLHPKDNEIGYGGCCPFHGNCLEGMISLHSLNERTWPVEATAKTIEEWTALAYGVDRNKETALFKALIESKLGIDIAAHYIAQLVHPLMLSPSLPESIVIGGRYAREAVLQAVRDKISIMIGQYPQRSEYGTPKKLETFIEKAHVSDLKSIEIIGALEIARGLARRAREGDPPSQGEAHSDKAQGDNVVPFVRNRVNSA